MHDDVAVIQKRPASVGGHLAVGGLDGRLLAQLVLDLVDDGVHLAGVGGRGDDEVVGHADKVAHFLHHDIGGLLLIGSLGGDERALPREGGLLLYSIGHSYPHFREHQILLAYLSTSLSGESSGRGARSPVRFSLPANTVKGNSEDDAHKSVPSQHCCC